MTLTIDLPDEQTAALAAKARELGISAEEYARHVPRILLRITPYCTADATRERFSLDLYLKHREYKALVGAVLMAAGVVVKMILTKSNR